MGGAGWQSGVLRNGMEGSSLGKKEGGFFFSLQLLTPPCTLQPLPFRPAAT